jgi:hypothetical protein
MFFYPFLLFNFPVDMVGLAGFGFLSGSLTQGVV